MKNLLLSLTLLIGFTTASFCQNVPVEFSIHFLGGWTHYSQCRYSGDWHTVKISLKDLDEDTVVSSIFVGGSDQQNLSYVFPDVFQEPILNSFSVEMEVYTTSFPYYDSWSGGPLHYSETSMFSGADVFQLPDIPYYDADCGIRGRLIPDPRYVTPPPGEIIYPNNCDTVIIIQPTVYDSRTRSVALSLDSGVTYNFFYSGGHILDPGSSFARPGGYRLYDPDGETYISPDNPFIPQNYFDVDQPPYDYDYTITSTDVYFLQVIANYTQKPLYISRVNNLQLQMTATNTSLPVNNGSINLTPTGTRNPPLTYTWSTGDSTQDISGLSAGMYGVTVTDACGIVNIDSVFIEQDPCYYPMDLQLVVTDADSAGAATGSIDLTVNNPNGNDFTYHYTWSNGDTVQDPAMLPAGIYQVTVEAVHDSLGSCSATSHRVFLSQPAGSLAFDNVDDYISIPASAATNSLTTYTFSAWLYVNANGNYNPIFYKQNGTQTDIEMYGRANDFVVLHNRNNPPGGGSLISPALPVGRWFHLAVTYDGTNFKTYYDGVLQGTSAAGTPKTDSWNIDLGLVTNIVPNHYFDGKMDEVRLFNVALNEATINDAMHCELSGLESNLVFYYDFNNLNAKAGGDNAGDTILTDAGPNLINGTLHNFSLIDTVSNWILQADPVSVECEAGALAFRNSGVNNYVWLFNAPRNITTYTYATWLYVNNNVSYNPIFIKGEYSDDIEIYGTATTLTVAHNRGNGGTFGYHYFPVLPEDQWVHLAVTYDGTTASVYFNGVLQSSAALPAPDPNNIYVRLGGSTVGFSSTTQYHLDGKMDEARLFNKALTAAEVQQQMSCLVSGDSRLVFYYDFNNTNATAGGNNAGRTTVADRSGNGKHASLWNFNLTGYTSNWVTQPHAVNIGGDCALRLIATTPAHTANSISRSSNIILTFDVAVDTTTVNNGNIIVTGSQTGLITGTLSGGGTNTIIFNPATDYKPGEVISVTLTTDLVSSGGGAFYLPYHFEFRVEANPINSVGTIYDDHTISTNATSAQSVYAADVDGDGHIDVLSASDGKIAWYKNNGSGVFTPYNISTSSTLVDYATSVHAADIDGDGDMDVLSAAYTSDKIVWYENDNQVFTAHVINSTTLGSPLSVYAADVDGDGDMDVLSGFFFGPSQYRKIAWYENNNQVFTERIIHPLIAVLRSVYAADVDGDGDMDVLMAYSEYIGWLENNGSQGFTQHVISGGLGTARSVYAADVDGDGDMDVLSAYGNSIAWHENDGNGDFPYPANHHVITATANLAQSVYAADVDGDGDMDVLSASYDDDKIAWYKNNGSQVFTIDTVTLNADGAQSVYAADIDGDGDMDILSASEDDNKIAWYEIVEASLKVEVKAFLGGPYDEGTALMNDHLRTSGYMPLTEPHTGEFIHHAPGGSEVIDTSILLIADSNAIVDWVFIELRDKNDSTVVVATRSALIQRDGDVIDLDGISPLGFNETDHNSYYVVIRHANHLSVMTASPVALSSEPVFIDFTNPATATYGTDAQEAVSDKMVMWAGEAVQDGVIKYSGQNNDRDLILIKIGGVVPTNVEQGYYPEDINRDGVVKYSGAENDRDIILQNIGGLVPTNTIIEQLPD